MIKSPSLVNEFSLCFSGDPALSLPEDETERERVLNEARLTGRWDSLVKGNDQPTVFQFKNLTRTEFNWIAGESTRRNLHALEINDLVVRVALREVENFGKHKVRRVKVNDEPAVWAATTDIIDAIHAEAGKAGDAILLELGNHIYARAVQQLGPL